MHAFDVGLAKAAGPSSGSLTTATLSNIVSPHSHEKYETDISIEQGVENKMQNETNRNKQ